MMMDKAHEGVLALQTARKVSDVHGERVELAISVTDLVRLLEAAYKLQRGVLGKADEIHATEIILEANSRFRSLSV